VFIAQGAQAAAIVINGLEASTNVRLPEQERSWSVAFTSSELPNDDTQSGLLSMQGYSIALLLSGYMN